MKLKEIKSMGVSELRQREAELRKELFTIRIQKQVGQLENHVRARTVRKELAQVFTVSKEHSAAN